jgi:hypothetical protein
VTIVPVGDSGEGVGNIDKASVWGVHVDGTLRLDPLGFTGAKIDLDAVFRKSRLIDPVTGTERAFDYFQPRNVEVDFRHDIPRTDLAWGFGLRNTAFAPYHRVAEAGLDYNNPTNLRIFIEHKNVFGLTVQARLNNILEGQTVLDRVVHDGPRSTSPVLFAENRRRDIGRIVNFTVKGNF